MATIFDLLAGYVLTGSVGAGNPNPPPVTTVPANTAYVGVVVASSVTVNNGHVSLIASLGASNSYFFVVFAGGSVSIGGGFQTMTAAKFEAVTINAL